MAVLECRPLARLLGIGLVALALGGAAGPLSGCGTRFCADAGCGYAVEVTVTQAVLAVTGPVVITGCVDGACQETHTFGREAGNAFLGLLPGVVLDPDAPHRVSVTLVNADRRTLLELDRGIELDEYRPTGGGCDPVCYRGSLAIGPGDLQPRAT